MPALAAAIITALSWVMKFMLAKAMLAFGLQLAVVAGYDVLLSWVFDQVMNNILALDPTIYAIVVKTRIPDAIAIIGAAMTVKASFLYGAGKLALVARGG